jgi:hypothetical protein
MFSMFNIPFSLKNNHKVHRGMFNNSQRNVYSLQPASVNAHSAGILRYTQGIVLPSRESLMRYMV